MDLYTADFDYDLPEDLIAQTPAAKRDESRLMLLDRASGHMGHSTFAEVARHVRPSDVLIANRSKVIPARLSARKETGGAVEFLLLKAIEPHLWSVLARPSRKLRPGMKLQLEGSALSACIEEHTGEGEWRVRFEGAPDIAGALHDAGSLPLPPYIRNGDVPPERYQTVYGDQDGSVASPTAGLHFTAELLDQIRESGARIEYVTLHIGMGTFRPVTAERVVDHRMQAEWGEVTADVARSVNTARSRGGRAIAVGTTATRLLETAALSGRLEPFEGETDRFIYPGYRFRGVDALLTNFHLPRSTLLMLVSAFAGRDLVLRAYREAIREQYRFYSFGDAMLIV